MVKYGLAKGFLEQAHTPFSESSPVILTGATRFDRGSWRTLVLVLALSAYGVIMLAAPLRLPTDGWAHSDDLDDPRRPAVVVRPLIPEVAAFEPGDEVLAIDGQPMAAIAERAYAFRLIVRTIGG